MEGKQVITIQGPFESYKAAERWKRNHCPAPFAHILEDSQVGEGPMDVAVYAVVYSDMALTRWAAECYLAEAGSVEEAQ